MLCSFGISTEASAPAVLSLSDYNKDTCCVQIKAITVARREAVI